MSVDLKTKSLEEIFEEMTDSYSWGEYIEGVTQWGDDALMSPKTFGNRFANVCYRYGYRESEIIPFKLELEQWCQDHLAHLENKFR